MTEGNLRDQDQALSDQELAHRAQRGDRAAFGELVARCRDGVTGVVYRLCGDPQTAEDAAQDAFVRAWRSLSSYNPRYSFRSWVGRIALNAALDTLRREKETLDVDELPLADGTRGPEAALEQVELSEQVRRAVIALPPASRAVLILREWGGLSYTEIAGTLNIPLGTVMSRLNSARGQLRQALAPLREVQ